MQVYGVTESSFGVVCGVIHVAVSAVLHWHLLSATCNQFDFKGICTGINLQQHLQQKVDLSDGVCRSVVASEGLGVWGGLWIQVMGDLLLPLMADLARYVSTRPRDFPGTSPFTHPFLLSSLHLAIGSYRTYVECAYTVSRLAWYLQCQSLLPLSSLTSP